MYKVESTESGPTGGLLHGVQRGRLTSVALLTVFGVICAAQLQAQAPDVHDRNTTPPDAEVLLWERDWTLNADGSSVYHEKKHTLLASDRVYRELADPRITYNAATDKLEILVGRVRRADGTYRELPDYSHVEVSPDATQRWPAFADIRQHLLVMSGVEAGCVLEVEYKITSKPGSKPYLAADLRLDAAYPVRRHTISVDVPPGTKLRAVLSGLPGERKPTASTASEWNFADLPARPEEPHSPPWQVNCARLTFSTAGSPTDWLERRLGQIEAAADDSELVQELAAEWTKDHKGADDKLRAIQEKLAARFNFVDFPVAWRPATIRPASEVAACNYGLPAEAAALLLALARAADLSAEPAVLVPDHVWLEGVPQDGLIAAYAVVLDTPDGLEIWDAHDGLVDRQGWAGHTMLRAYLDKIERTRLASWTAADESRCRVRGEITLDEEGAFTGEVTFRTTGLFVAPESLRTSDDQKKRVSALLEHVLPLAKVESFSVTTLAAHEFEITAQIESSKPLKKVGEAFCLQLAENGPYAVDVPAPVEPQHAAKPGLADGRIRLRGGPDNRVAGRLDGRSPTAQHLRHHRLTGRSPAGMHTRRRPFNRHTTDPRVRTRAVPGGLSTPAQRHKRAAQRLRPHTAAEALVYCRAIRDRLGT